MTNSTYSHAIMNNNKDNSFCDCVAKNDEDSCTSRGVNNTTHNILSARGSKSPVKALNLFENKTNLSFHSRASSRNNFVKCPTERENKKKAIRKSIHDLINRNFNMNNYYKNMNNNNNKKKESVFNNINKIKSFSNGLKMKSKEVLSRNQNQITLKQLNGKELSFGIVDESGNKKEDDVSIKN